MLFKVVVKMPLLNPIERSLHDLKENPDIEEVTLISRSGMHIAGNVPDSAHRETYVAMAAILLGAAETATTELNEELLHVIIELNNSKILIINSGSTALFSVKIKSSGNVNEILDTVSDTIEDLKEHL
ncbi:MAG: roadblock/LC7 domain-containing protein [Thermoplasmata archaeon]